MFSQTQQFIHGQQSYQQAQQPEYLSYSDAQKPAPILDEEDEQDDDFDDYFTKNEKLEIELLTEAEQIQLENKTTRYLELINPLENKASYLRVVKWMKPLLKMIVKKEFS
ncbi:UNKNOWN [Stylonychia lemnae]|uniref:Uncharacterized protein n=1 Tax=Stylonychia lemnae TaxID=5949 RepID=A0A078B183_STYLE|nr:UNKNOWN [Stylonychia lemnae]|eukprot:CDW87117.1 UNKNOWN [Stylonychia lemnae]